MDFLYFKFFYPLLFIILIGFLTSCGTSERATQNDSSRPANEDGAITLKSTPENPPENNSATPAKKPFVIPTEDGVETVHLIEDGKASWYGPNFHGRLTANGEEYDMYGMTAAHRTLPFNTLVLVENLDSGRTILVRINDRGPFAKNRIIDLSKKAAAEIGMIGPGTANVNLYVAKKSSKALNTKNLKVATYTVQLGSFKTEAQAFNYSSKIKGSRVEIVRKKNQKIYRVYYGLFIDKNKAAEKQKELERNSFSGYVKQIENG